VPRLFELPTALLGYLDLLQGKCSPSALQGCYTYMIIKMTEIYNIAAQPCEPMHTTLKQSQRAPRICIYRLKEDASLPAMFNPSFSSTNQ